MVNRDNIMDKPKANNKKTVPKSWILPYSNCQNTRQLKTSLAVVCRAAPVPTLAREARPHLQTGRSTAAGLLKYDLCRCCHTNISPLHCRKLSDALNPTNLKSLSAKAALLVFYCFCLSFFF